jgi:hypothetical protein
MQKTIMKSKLILLALFSFLLRDAYSQLPRTGRNQCVIRIVTDSKVYQFNTREMSATLSTAMNRFEFTIPINTIQTLRDSGDIEFIKGLANGRETIIINAVLPDDKDGVLDLSYFRGNKFIQLAGEMMMGKYKFEDEVDFNGLLIGGSNQIMAFNFNLFINARRLTLDRINNEQIVEIELDAKGDRIIGLTSN